MSPLLMRSAIDFENCNCCATVEKAITFIWGLKLKTLALE